MNRRESLALIAAIGGACISLPRAALAQVASLQAAGTRRALVIGNSTYTPERQAVPSSRKNANDVASALEALGFQVTRETDVGTQAMHTLVQQFFAAVRAASGGPALG